MDEEQRKFASFLYMARENNLMMDENTYCKSVQKLVDSGDIWRFDETILNRVADMYFEGYLPYKNLGN